MQERHAKCENKAKRIVFENNAGGGVAYSGSVTLRPESR